MILEDERKGYNCNQVTKAAGIVGTGLTLLFLQCYGQFVCGWRVAG